MSPQKSFLLFNPISKILFNRGGLVKGLAYRSLSTAQVPVSENQKLMVNTLKEEDAELFDLIQLEQKRQRDSIVLIASENFTSKAVSQALGSVLQNKYSEGYPGARYYGGNEYIDHIERICQRRALEAFDLDPHKWGVNVQALSGAPANLYVYAALLNPHERIMSLDLPHGGHLSHGYQTESKKISKISAYFETFPYRVDEKTGIIDYDALERNATLYRPKILVAGASAYPRNIDYARMRTIANNNNSHLLVDMAHLSGMVAAGLLPSPFEFADVVTTTTHKSLRGPRGALIFFRRGVRSINKDKSLNLYDLEDRINFSVFPGHQGGPHNHTIGALAVALKQAKSPEFIEYQRTVLENSQAFSKAFKALGYDLVTDGTDTHLILLDLRSKEIDGARVERMLELVQIVVNKNTIPSDRSALVPFGIRIGTPAMTTRGMKPQDCAVVAELVDRGVELAKRFQAECVQTKKLKDFKTALNESSLPEMIDLRNEVIEFSRQFPVVGIAADSIN